MTSASPSRSRWRVPVLPTLVVAALALALIGTFLLRRGAFARTDPLEGRATATVTRGALVARVTATGTLEPRMTSALTFPAVGGQVQQVLVAEGDAVSAEQPLLTLATGRLDANVAAAEATVAKAQADLLAVREGATSEQVAAAAAQVAAARGTLAQTAGSVTGADVQAVQARIAEAQALLARLIAGPKVASVQAADAQLQQAELAIVQQRDALSAAKTIAAQSLQQAAAALTQAQSDYATARSNWEYVQAEHRNPATKFKLNAVQQQQYYDAFVKAEAGLRSAEAGVQQAQVASDAAQQAEASGIAQAEAQVRAAQANRASVGAPTDPDQIAAARAQLASARADSAKLQGQQRAGTLQNARANVADAEARLAQLQADPKASDLARAEASVKEAQAQLLAAQTERADATLRAPFAGVIGTVAIAPGETIGTAAPLTLLDTTRYRVKLSVDEVDVTRVREGQAVEVVIEALDTVPLTGTVRRITPQSKATNTVTTYAVTVELDPATQPVKPGMTVRTAIVTARADAVLLLPAQAIRTENGATLVDVVTTGADGQRTAAATLVTVGLRADDRVEVRSGLAAGAKVLLP